MVLRKRKKKRKKEKKKGVRGGVHFVVSLKVLLFQLWNVVGNELEDGLQQSFNDGVAVPVQLVGLTNIPQCIVQSGHFEV
jgi:hypothetical protein